MIKDYPIDIINKYENLKDGYYHLMNDILAYPDAWCHVVWSMRGPGKTYSNLWESYYLNEEIGLKNMYIKRTNKDVQFICQSAEDAEYNPFNPICRDKGIIVKPKLITQNSGGFYKAKLNNDTGEMEPYGLPFVRIQSLNDIKSVKGFDASTYDWITLDEFIPQAGEIVRRQEGEMVLDLYMTAQRDRIERGFPPQKLILFANAEEISTPITRELEIIDDMAELQFSGKSHKYLADREILLHHITATEYPMKKTKNVGIYKGMAGTSWAKKAFEGDFSKNDFTNVCNLSLKHYKAIARFLYRGKMWYIYRKENKYYICRSHNRVDNTYNLERESEQKAFYYDYILDLQEALIEDVIKFESYSIYDLVNKYKKYFDI